MPEFRDFVCFLSAKALHYTHCLWFSRFCQKFLPFFRESHYLGFVMVLGDEIPCLKRSFYQTVVERSFVPLVKAKERAIRVVAKDGVVF
jgi:hypothetical protein